MNARLERARARAYAYGAKLGDPQYDPLLDRNQDGAINIFDVVRVGGAYGTQYFKSNHIKVLASGTATLGKLMDSTPTA